MLLLDVIGDSTAKVVKFEQITTTFDFYIT